MSPPTPPPFWKFFPKYTALKPTKSGLYFFGSEMTPPPPPSELFQKNINFCTDCTLTHSLPDMYNPLWDNKWDGRTHFLMVITASSFLVLVLWFASAAWWRWTSISLATRLQPHSINNADQPLILFHQQCSQYWQHLQYSTVQFYTTFQSPIFCNTSLLLAV